MNEQQNLNNICLICDSSDDIVTFSCMDQYCSQCMQQWITTKLEDQGFDLKCSKCNQKIDVQDLKFCLEEKLFERLCQYMLHNNQIQDVNSDEKIIDCFGIDCGSKLIIWKNAGNEINKIDYYECKFGCKQKFCLNCKGLYHDKISCKQASQLKSLDKIKEYINIKTSGYGICPFCHTTIEKEEGCNFIICGSSLCNKDNCFCFNCEMKLTIEDHYDHYEDNNPYQGNCKIKSKDGQWVTDIDESKKAKLGEQQGPNTFSCPGCGTYDSKNCTLEQNFSNQVCFCKSSQCKMSYFCMKCESKVTEGKFLQHFDDQYNCLNKRSCQIQ